MRFIDLHCDTISEIRDHPGQPHHICPGQLPAANVELQCFALFTDLARQDAPEKRALELYGTWLSFLEDYSDQVLPVANWQDAIDAGQTGRTGALLCLEEGDVVFGSVSFLETWYRLGVRMITLTWNHPNRLADAHGLSAFGRAYVRKMEELGIVVDVSHLPDKAFWDVAAMARRPFVASHSNARALCDVPRNLSDDMIRAVAASGGIIGLNFCGLFLCEEGGRLLADLHAAQAQGNEARAAQLRRQMEEADRSCIDDMIRHIRHIMQVGGDQVIALGTDFDGITSRLEIDRPARLPLLADRMRQEGFTEAQIAGFCHENAQRLFRQILEGR